MPISRMVQNAQQRAAEARRAAAVGSVNKLDTRSFDGAISAFSQNINDFRQIVSGVNTTCQNAANQQRWRGRGRNKFNDDYQHVQRNLQCIIEVMENARSLLEQSKEQYGETDSQLSSNFRQ